MIVFGLVLLILAIIVIAYVWLATAGMTPISIDYGILNVELTPLWFFFAGGITLAVATSGLWLMGVGARSSARRAKEVRELRRQAKETDRRAERDRDRAALGTDPAHGTGTPATDRRTTAPARDRAVAGPGEGGAASRRGSAAGEYPGSPRTDGAEPGADQQPILPRPGRDEAGGTPAPGARPADPDR